MARYVPNPTPGALPPGDLFENLGAAMAARYAEAENRMIDRVARLTEKGLEVPPTMAERVRVLGELRAEGERIARDLADPELAARIVATAAADGEAAAIGRLGIGRDLNTPIPITGAAANAVGQIALDLSSSLENMSERITRWMPDAYRRVISMTAPSVILGVDTIQQAQRNAASRFLARGVRGFTDQAGKEWRIGSYAEMATRTTVNRAWQSANIAVSQDAGLNLCTIVLGVDVCNKCAPHGGKIYSTDGTPAGVYTLPHATEGRGVQVTVAGTLDQAKAAGWNHPNCRCVVVAYLPGLSIPEGRTYDPQAEKDRDRLRELERRVRDLKRKEAAAFDDITKANLRRRIRATQGDIREHVGRTGLIRKPYREALGFSDGRPPALPTPPRPRPVVPPALPPVSAPRALPATSTSTLPLADRLRAIDQAKTVDAVIAATRTALGSRAPVMTGFTGTMSPESVKGATRALVKLMDKYPQVNLTSFSASTIRSRGVLAMARGIYAKDPVTGQSKIVRQEITVSSTRLQKRNRAESVQTVDYAVGQGHFHPIAEGVDQFEYIVTHEFGHTVDYAGQERIRKEAGRIRTQYLAELGERPLSKSEKTVEGYNDHARRKAIGTSGYGQSSPGELIAEAFADVEVNGPAAKELSKRIHARMIEILREENL